MQIYYLNININIDIAAPRLYPRKAVPAWRSCHARNASRYCCNSSVYKSCTQNAQPLWQHSSSPGARGATGMGSERSVWSLAFMSKSVAHSGAAHGARLRAAMGVDLAQVIFLEIGIQWTTAAPAAPSSRITARRPRGESESVSATRTSLLMSFAEKYTLLLLGMAGSMIIARLLTPAQIGIFSVGSVVVGMAQLIRDFGVGQYLIQERELSSEKIRAAFTLTLLIAWAVAALLVLLSGPAARFYGVPELGAVLRVLALNCLLIPFGSITLPYLRRQLRFGAIYCINVASGVADFLVCIGLAVAGFGFMSLAWGAVAGSAAAVLGSLYFRPAQMAWRPGWRGMRQLLSFGAYATGSNLLDEAGVAAPDLIIGKLIGMEGVGLFSKAQGVLGMFNLLITRAITPVVLPLYAAQARDGADMRLAYLRTISYMAALAWPFFAVLGVLALPVVRLLYGSQWDAAVPLVRSMCLSAAVFSLFGMARDLFVAMGQVRQRARLELLAVPLRILGIGLAAPFGLQAVAWSIVATTLLKSWLIYRVLARLTGLRPGQLGAAVAPGAALSVLSVLAPLWLTHGMAFGLAQPGMAQPGQGQLLAPLALAGLGAVAAWSGGIFLSGHALGRELAAALARLPALWRARRARH